MSKPIPSYLRLHVEEAPDIVRPEVEDLACLGDLCRGFEAATGWTLRYAPGREPTHDPDLVWSAPVNPGVGAAPGHLRIDLGGPAPTERGHRADLDAASGLADMLSSLVSELAKARHALWQREAELAAGIPVIVTTDEAQHLAVRLEAVLHGAAEVTGCQAACLYMLDAATTELKLRSAWGLSPARLAEPARPLRGAIADLEALSGHAVVLEDAHLFPIWNVPESAFGAAVCLPVANGSIPLGTLWIFSRTPRVFTEHDTQVLEIIAGRLAAELDRAVLMSQGASAAVVEKQLLEVQESQQHQFPTVAPQVENWSIAACSNQAGQVGGAFHDWFINGQNELALVIGRGEPAGMAGAISAASTRAGIRALGEIESDPGCLLERAGCLLWSTSAGDATAAAGYFLFDPLLGVVRFALAGHIQAILIRPSGWEAIGQAGRALGIDPNPEFEVGERMLAPGETLLLLSADFAAHGEDSTGANRPFAVLADFVREHAQEPVDRLMQQLREQIEGAGGAAQRPADTSLVLVRRRN